MQLGGYDLETNFVIVDEALGVENLLLGQNVLRKYQVLVDSTAMKVVVRLVWYPVHAQVSEHLKNVPVYLAQVVILQPSERGNLKAKWLTDDLDEFAFRSVFINFAAPDRVCKKALL